MKKIILYNYRCFKNLPLEFSDKVNLLIGDNASGKTTIIRAVSAALSSFFAGFSDENTRFTGLEKEDFRIVRAEESLANEEPINIKFEWLDKKGELILNSAKGRTLQDPLKELKNLGAEIYKGMFQDGKQIIALPMFTSFSTADIHKPRRFGSDIFKKYEHKPSFGYYECFQGDGFMKYWTLRLLVLREGRTGELEVEGVLKALKKALGRDGCNIISDVDIRPIQGKIYYILSDNRETDTDNLSDGYRRLINIVLDLAFRCMLLNKGIYGLEACVKTKGTVLIDEIDLHLHPTLQSVVMKGLQKAFPNLQFIITSHAPMIMSSISLETGNKIIKLQFSETNGYEANETKLFGMDASTIIETELNIPSRDANVQESLDSIFDLIDDENIEEARGKLNAMKEKFDGTIPELAKAESMINFLTARNDKDK
jgi:predicted ATP-binding protein involved in virulence